MADKVAALQQSLDMLGHVSDYEERRQTLEEHRNRLEATASPHFVAAITDADTGPLSRNINISLLSYRFTQYMVLVNRMNVQALVKVTKQRSLALINLVLHDRFSSRV